MVKVKEGYRSKPRMKRGNRINSYNNNLSIAYELGKKIRVGLPVWGREYWRQAQSRNWFEGVGGGRGGEGGMSARVPTKKTHESQYAHGYGGAKPT